VTNSNHFGVAAYHLEPLADAGLVGLAMGNSPAAMPAWGGKRPLFGTNPIAAGFPRRGAPPLMIDVSLSAVARGKIMVAAREGKPIPEGWAVDKDGRATTDAKAALEGSMLPAGGVKGAMLALMVELLVCALSGSAYGFESDSFFTEEGRPTRIGQAFLAIDPGALAGKAVYEERMETLVAAMLADDEVRLPGERRRANRERAQREGVAIPADLLAKIRTLAGEASHA
jgi:(2R)-3-sulfolactate dehydrogenase (NADP+)